MVLCGVVLEPLVRLDDVSGVSKGHRPVETVSEGFADECPCSGVMRSIADVDVTEQLLPLLGGNTLEEYPRGALAVELPNHELVALGPPH